MGVDLVAALVVAFALTYLIHSTLLLAGAWLITNALPDRPRRSARTRERLWRVAFLGGFVTAGLQLGLGLESPLVGWALHQEPAPATAALEPPPAAVFRTAEAGAPPERELPRVPAPSGSVGRPAEPAPVVPVRAEPAELAPLSTASTGARSPTAPPVPWTSVIAAGWALAGLVVLAFLAVLVVRLRRSLAGRSELRSGPLFELVGELRGRARVRRTVRLYVAPRLTAPISVGWLRPAICVPPRALSDLAPEEQEAMVAHELAHLARRDPAWFFLCWLIESLFFFQPLNRLARRRLQDAAEMLCDDWAVRHTGRDLSLASCLARIAEWIVERPRPLLAAHMTHGVPATANHARSRLGQRIERLLDEHRAPEPPRRWIAPLALGLLGSLTLVGPGVAAVGEPEPRPAPLPEPAPRPDPASSVEPTPAARPQPAPVPEPVLPIQPGELFGVLHPASPGGLEAELVSLDGEVAELETELRALRGELEALDLDPKFDRALGALEARTRELTERRQRLDTLVQRAQARTLRP